MNFLKGFSITASSNAILVIAAFLNNVIITRQIGTEGRGQYIVITNLILFLTLLLGEGIRRSNTILIGKDKSVLSRLILNNFIYSLLVAILLFFIYFFKNLWHYFLPNIPEFLFFISLLIIIFAIMWQGFQAIFLGLQKYYEFNFIQLLPTLITFVINLIGIYVFNFQLLQIIISLFFATIISFLFGLLSFKDSIFKGSPSTKILNSNFGFLSFKSTISASFIFILLRANVFLINFFLGAHEAGIYSIAYLFLDMTQKLPNIASPILISKTVSDFGKSSIINTSRLVRVVLIINLAIVIFLFLFGKWIIIFLFRSEFEESYYILLYLLPGILFFGCGAIIYAYYMSREYPPNIIIFNGFFALLSVILNIFLIPIHGLIAVALIISFTFSTWTLVLINYFVHENKISLKEILLINKDDINYLINFSLKRN